MTLLDAIEGAEQKLLRPSGGCHNCPRHRVDYVPPTLLPTKIIFVGEAPGGKEVEEGEGFVGRAGQLLRTTAAACGIREFSVTNITHCRPPENATPGPKEIGCCLSEFVLDELRGYPIVVLCGTVALTALFPKAKASHFRGNVAYHPDFPGQQFYTMYHPAYIVRPQGASAKAEFEQQMQRLARIAAGEAAPTWRVLQGGTEEMFAALDTTLAAPLISLDFETTALESWRPHEHIRCLSLTADAQTVVFAHRDEPHWGIVTQKIGAYLATPGKAVVGANIGFDLDWAQREFDFKTRCAGIQDVAVIYYEWKQYKEPSLKELAAKELDGYRYLAYEPSTETDLNLLALYNAEDVIYPLQLLRKALPQLKPKMRDLVTRVLGPVCLCLREMQANGFYLRQDYREQKIDEYETRRRDEIEAWCTEDPAFIPTVHESGKGLHEYLFKVHNLPVLEYTDKKGTPAVDKRVIKQWIRDGYIFLQHLLTIREIDKIKSTFLTAYDDHLDNFGRIHPSFINTFTDSGRTSARKPNSQNIPRKKEIRDLFGVPPGSWLMEGDLSQIEFRIMVSRARDETGIAAYLRGEDAHTTTARTIAGGEPTKEQRSLAKPVNFALIYGGTWENVQRQARDEYDVDWDKVTCQRFTDGFFGTYRRLPEFHAWSRDQLVRNRGWFESVLGHTFFYRDWDSPDQGRRDHTFRAALNSEGQGPAAQICFAIMVEARRLLVKHGLGHVRYVNHVHDSVLIELSDRKDDANVIELFEQAVATVYEWIKPWFLVPLIMDYKGGESWGSLEEYNIGR